MTSTLPSNTSLNDWRPSTIRRKSWFSPAACIDASLCRVVAECAVRVAHFAQCDLQNDVFVSSATSRPDEAEDQEISCHACPTWFLCGSVAQLMNRAESAGPVLRAATAKPLQFTSLDRSSSVTSGADRIKATESTCEAALMLFSTTFTIFRVARCDT